MKTIEQVLEMISNEKQKNEPKRPFELGGGQPPPLRGANYDDPKKNTEDPPADNQHPAQCNGKGAGG